MGSETHVVQTNDEDIVKNVCLLSSDGSRRLLRKKRMLNSQKALQTTKQESPKT